jgi:histidinol-phosphate phosphatase family protein
MTSISQAVVLAGGRGTRLAPLTDDRPKPMIEFHGRPFLAYLVDLLREQGIERVLLLLGYLPNLIVDYFGNGERFGLEMSYSITPEGDDTGLRIKRAQARLDPEFLLMYCDNIWPLPFERLEQAYRASGAPMQVVVYENDDDYTRDNLRVEDGFVVAYDKMRQTPGLKGVDIGFMLMTRELVETLPDGNVSFEATLYPQLVAERKLSAFVTGHRYYSVGSHARLPLTASYLTGHPAVIFDRDGVLNARMPRADYVKSWSDWRWREGVLEALAKFAAAGWRIIIVTNQAGIARGIMTEDDLAAIHQRMKQEVAAAGGRIDAVYHCPHGWNDGCRCRKPRPGMLFQAQRDFDLDLSRIYFIGDDERDGQAAAAAGCRYVSVEDHRPLSSIADWILTQARN